MSLAPGTRLGPYVITSAIGAGGMGEVYRARDTKLGRDVAIKVLPEAFSEDPERLARFQREAQVLASLNHPNIASIHGFEESDGVKALVLELVEGPTLTERIQERRIPVDEAVAIARQIAEALEAGHEAGVIHRDLKPANVKVKDDGTVKVLDYGLAKVLKDDAPSGAVENLSQSPTLTRQGTQIGVILGTAAYMSPEQAKGKPVDKRTDIFAFGAVLYEMLTGKRAFAGDDVADTLSAVLRAEPALEALPAATPASVRRLLRRCLEKDARLRLRDIGDARIELLELPAVSGTDEEEDKRTRPVARRLRNLSLVPTLAVAMLAGLIGWSLRPGEETAPVGVTRFSFETPPFQPNAKVGSQVALSRDGSRLAYAADSKLYLREMDTWEAVPIPDTADAYTPFFSPDGEWVGFFTATQLKKVSIAGGAAATVTSVSAGRAGVWTDADDILFSVYGPSSIFRVPASGGRAAPLTTLAEGHIDHDHQMDVLPDGDHVLLGVIEADDIGWDDAHLAVHSIESGELEMLLDGGQNAFYTRTGHLVFARAGALLAVAFDLSRLEVQGEPRVVLEGLLHPFDGTPQFSLSRNGSLAYVSASSGSGRNRVLVWVDREGGEQRLPLPARPFASPRISPDGARIALCEVDSDLNLDIRIYDLARGALHKRVTTNPGMDWSPVWAPDGERVYFVTPLGGGIISWKGVDDNEQGEVLPGWRAPHSISPDGAFLAYFETNPETGQDIGIVALGEEGSSPRTLFATSFTEENPTISPDGRWIAYHSTESGRSEVYVTPFPDVDRNRWQVSVSGGHDPTWAASGSELFFVGDNAMMSVDIVDAGESLQFGQPEMLFDGDFVWSSSHARQYDVAPDGQRFLMMKPEEGSPQRIHVVLNWFEDLKRLVPTE